MMRIWIKIAALAMIMAACGTPINYQFLVEAESQVSRTNVFLSLDGNIAQEEIGGGQAFTYTFERRGTSTLLITFHNPTSDADTISIRFYRDGRLLDEEELPLRPGGKVTWDNTVNEN